MGLFSLGGSVSNNNGSTNSDEDTVLKTIKDGMANSTGVVTNSGSTNTGQTTTTNSGSTNNSNTVNSGSTNQTTQTNSGSTNTTNTAGSINTSQLMLSDDAVSHMTQQLLEGSQGLTAVSKGQMSAGGYNSTANTMLTNDLLSRVAGEVAARGAVTKTTIGPTSSTTNIGGSTSIVDQILGGSSSNTTQNIGGSSSIANVLNTIGGSTATTSTNTTSKDVTNGQSSTTKNTDTNQKEEKGSVGWIVCTELVRQGRMPKRFYVYGVKVFDSYKEHHKPGYYYWAVPSVNHLRSHPTSIRSKLLELVMNPRAEYLAAEAGCRGAKKTVAGFLSKHILFVISVGLSYTLAKGYDARKHYVPITGV